MVKEIMYGLAKNFGLIMKRIRKSSNDTSTGRSVIYYYEIHPALEEVFGNIYLYTSHRQISTEPMWSMRPMQSADRVWKLDEDGTVRFVKNRFTGLTTPVDMKEFALVQYAASCYTPKYD